MKCPYCRNEIRYGVRKCINCDGHIRYNKYYSSLVTLIPISVTSIFLFQIIAGVNKFDDLIIAAIISLLFGCTVGFILWFLIKQFQK